MDVSYLYIIYSIYKYICFLDERWDASGCLYIQLRRVFHPLLVTWRFNSLYQVLQTRSPSISATKEFSDSGMEGKEPHEFFWMFLSMASGTTAFSRASSSAWWVCGWPWMVRLLRPVPPPRFWHRRLFGDFLGDEKCAGFWRKSNQISIVRGGWCLRYLGWRDKKMQPFFESGILFGSNEAAGWTDEAEGWTNKAEGWTRQIKTLFPLVTTNMAIFWDLPIEDGPNSRQLR